MRRNALAMVALLVSVTACGGGGDGGDGNPAAPTPRTPQPTSPMTPSNQVSVLDNEFSPATLTVATAATVTWSWSAGNYNSHNVTFADGVGSSSTRTSGTHQRTFSVAGSYAYSCTVHGASMTGTITVTQ